MNHLHYGDRRSRFLSLHVLRDSIAAESVDLICLDPPFNSKRDYNLFFKSPKGHSSEAQIEAFEDTGHCMDARSGGPRIAPPASHAGSEAEQAHGNRCRFGYRLGCELQVLGTAIKRGE